MAQVQEKGLVLVPFDELDRLEVATVDEELGAGQTLLDFLVEVIGEEIAAAATSILRIAK